DPGRGHLLGLAEVATRARVQTVDSRLSAGDHAVDDLLALTGPAGDCGRCAELHVVGVRHDAQGPLPVLVQWGQLGGGGCHAASMSDTFSRGSAVGGHGYRGTWLSWGPTEGGTS